MDELRQHPEVLFGAGLALLLVLLLTPAAGGMARWLGAVDPPDRRRLNLLPIPRLGGLALFFGILVPSLAFLPLGGESRGLLLGAAAIPVGAGIWVDRFTFPFLGIHELPAWLGMPLTVLWIVALMNMVNFLDGLDGLAAGVCAIAGSTFAVIELSLGKPTAAIFSA